MGYEDLFKKTEKEQLREEISKVKDDLKMYQEYLDREKNRSELLLEKVERYEEALERVVVELSKHCSEGWTTKSLEIAKEALNN